MRRSWILAAAVVACVDALDAQSGTTTCASVTPSGATANGSSRYPALTADGRYIVFDSAGDDLVPSDTNAESDIFLRDRASGVTARVSVAANGAQANGWSFTPSISADGRFVAFASRASNLGPPDASPGVQDIFVIERASGAVVLASVSTSGVGGNRESYWPTLSDDGRFVAFTSCATNLVPNDTNGGTFCGYDIFVRDLVAGTTERASVSSSGAQAAGWSELGELSGDGRYVVFESSAANLDPGDTNTSEDVFWHDRVSGVTVRCNVTASGTQSVVGAGYPSVSDDGRFVGFSSSAGDLVAGDTNGTTDVFVRDMLLGVTERVSVGANGEQGNSFSGFAELSSDGRYELFASAATNLVALDTNGPSDSFLHDRATGRTTRVCTSSAGAEPNGVTGGFGSLSLDARFVAFASNATNLTALDGNAATDLFVHDRGAQPSETYCTAKTSSLGCLPLIGFAGSPSATNGAGFLLVASRFPNQRFGLLAYGTNGAQATPFLGGTLCMQPPLRRIARQMTGGSAPGADDCSGTTSHDFASSVASGADPALVAGARAWAQYWCRDPGYAPPNSATLSDAVTFVLVP